MEGLESEPDVSGGFPSVQQPSSPCEGWRQVPCCQSRSPKEVRLSWLCSLSVPTSSPEMGTVLKQWVVWACNVGVGALAAAVQLGSETQPASMHCLSKHQ